ncbi:VOC family protein [Variovorax sp. KK3]|uniref:VOC family protein n=1 Tax=Variovorax sp. KK3 TaxID=1855728 RepID=UPI00097C86D9|nr:VOC family protein [Variovorax sp. KK3]
MSIRKLGHYSVRTAHLEASTRFYVEVLGLKVGYRPALDFPGCWLYCGGDEADFGVVHLIGTGGSGDGLSAYLGDKAASAQGTGALDHLAFLACDLLGLRERLSVRDIEFRERTLPGLGLHQVFFDDPSGLTIEMNFPAAEAEALDEQEPQQMFAGTHAAGAPKQAE